MRRSRKCSRCGLRFPRSHSRCDHCADLTDAEVAALKTRLQDDGTSYHTLGRYLYAAAVLCVLLIVLALL